MVVGVPKEVKVSENRVGLTESGVRQLVHEGHRVCVEKDAGLGCFITNQDYLNSGAELLDTAQQVYGEADMIVKVKEPLPVEYPLLKENQILYTYLHLAAEPELTKVLRQNRVKAVAYETIEDPRGGLPLLVPMSEVAGRMATQVGAFYLQRDRGGKGVLLGGVTGVQPGRVTIIGGGVVGVNAAQMAIGLGAHVSVFDINHSRLEYLDHIFQGRITTIYSNQKNIEEAVMGSDLVIGAVLIAGRKAPQLVSRKMIESMGEGSVVVDVAVDQGGCIETCRVTSHKEPTFSIDGVIHYCVPNMPGVVARTSTYALTHVTFKYASLIAQMGLEKAIESSPELEKGVNVYGGEVTYEPVARDLSMDYVAYSNLLPQGH